MTECFPGRECRDTGQVEVSSLAPFFTSKAQAIRVALHGSVQGVIEGLLLHNQAMAWRGRSRSGLCPLGLGMLLMLATLNVAMAQVAGSWTASAPALRVSIPGRVHQSAPLAPPRQASLSERELVSVSWRYESPAGADLLAWLCGAGKCVAAAERRGRTDALVGLPADGPLTLKFALPQGGGALLVEKISVVVDYR